MENLTGYRTIISILLQVLVGFGYLSQSDANEATEAIFGLLVATLGVAGIYFKLQSNRREQKLRDMDRILKEV
jgi:uncharacterized membrane protein YccC